MRWLVVLLAGCIPAMTNAPGVIDLAAPRVAADGYIQPADPGTEGFAVWVRPELFGGGEHSRGGGELGAEVHVEHFDDPYRGNFVNQANVFALGVFAALADKPNGLRVFAELQHRTTVAEAMPAEVGAGIAFDDDRMPGIQLSAHLLLFGVRLRAMVTGEVDFVLGFELPLVFVFGQSK